VTEMKNGDGGLRGGGAILGSFHIQWGVFGNRVVKDVIAKDLKKGARGKILEGF